MSCFSSTLKFAESLACGVPVIINAGVGDCDEIVRGRDVGAVVEDFSENGYSKAYSEMQRLLADRNAVALRCRESAIDYFSLNKGMDSYSKIYETLAE